MKKIIMIKYGELTTKKDNRNFFIKTLQKNIEEKLLDIKHITTYDYFRMFIECEEKDINKVIATVIESRRLRIPRGLVIILINLFIGAFLNFIAYAVNGFEVLVAPGAELGAKSCNV